MSNLKVILWDIDGTLLDFKAAEKLAIQACFDHFGLGRCTKEMLTDYAAINRRFWQQLERGELTREEILVGRFEMFFQKYGLDAHCAPAFNLQYQLALGDFVIFHPGGLETVQALRGQVKQYAVTNGTRRAQVRKLARSGLDRLLDGVFISEDVGVEKPGVDFFDAVYAKIGTYHPDEVLIVGDSLSSDIQGGNNAGILCCWFNPDGLPVPTAPRIDYEIRSIADVLALPCLGITPSPSL